MTRPTSLTHRAGASALAALMTLTWAAPRDAAATGTRLATYARPSAETLRQAREARRAQSLARLERVTDAARAQQKAARAKAAADAVVARIPDATLRHELAKLRTQKKAERDIEARLSGVAPAFGRAKQNVRPSPKLDVFSPPRLSPKRELPPAPRLRSNQLGTLSPDTEALYAQVFADDVWVEASDGSWLRPAEVVSPKPRPPVRLASLATDMGFRLPLLGVIPAPGPEDFAETPETLRTPEVVALATQLGNKPLALYNFVHTQVSTDIYWGSKKGAAATLAEKRGNDFDQASLLIALLRAAGFAARYEYGAVKLSLAQAQALTGGADAAKAAYLLSRAAIPAAVDTDGKSVLMEKVWVRAYVPYGNWRGSGPGGESVWVRLDPAMKLVARKAGVSLRNLVQFDFDSYLGALTGETPKDIYEKQLLTAAKSQNLCNTLDDALPSARITQEAFSLLPAEHPAKVISSLLLFARPPASMRHDVTLTLDGQAQNFELPQVTGRDVSITYVGATPADEAAITAAGGLGNVVPYQVRVVPVLKVAGQEVRRFNALMPGLLQNLTVRVTVPNATAATAVHRLTAGSPYALALFAGAPSVAQVDAYRRTAQAATGDARTLAELQLALSLYARQQQEDITRLYALEAHSAVQDVLEALAGKEFGVDTVNGTPVALLPGLYVIDVARDSLTPLPLNGDSSRVAYLARLAGHHGSALEHKVWENVFPTAAVSAVKILQAAASQTVPVYQLVQGSPQRSLLTGFSASTLNDIDSALGAGWRARIAQRPISYAQYQNQEGYILENPATGAGAYRINALLNGGGSKGGGNSDGPEGPECACDEVAGSRINVALGNWRESF
ncbi:MAG: transglutaminase domain-containing protein, partial [Myxococcaceae bacterium]